MDQEGPINFKALRAKFQEEAAQARDRPTIAEKPKRLPPPGGHCSSLVNSIHTAVENKTPVVPRVIFRDGTRASGGKRPISFPPHRQQTTPLPLPGGVDSTAKQSLRDRHMPLVLPAVPFKGQKTDPEPTKVVPPPIKCKKKGLLLPFKLTKVSKVDVESGEEPMHTGLTIEPPVAVSVVENQKIDDGVSLKGDHSTTECPPSNPDRPVTPTSAELVGDSSSMVGVTQFFDQHVLSTLEKAKKRFSPRRLLIYAKPKRSSALDLRDNSSTENVVHLPPKDFENLDPELLLPVPPPVCRPHLSCVVARPFIKLNGSSSTKSSQTGALLVKPGEPPLPPPKKPLPDLWSLRPLPTKPPRPPHIDLSCYHITTDQNQELTKVEQVTLEDTDSGQTSFVDLELDPPEFPDFENSETEAAEGKTFDLAALELAATDCEKVEALAALDLGPPEFEAPAPVLFIGEPLELASFDLQALSLINDDLVLPDTSIPPVPVVPEHWGKTQAVPAPEPEPQAVDIKPASAEPSVTEDTDPSSDLVINDDIQTQPSVYPDENYYEASDNVYEEVENINKFIRQNSGKLKRPPKNPYADTHPAKEEIRINIWPRNSCKERQSPENHEDKEQRKREKHRLEKEKKEQKEREKKEHEMKKKFKVTGHEEPMYHARVTVASKVRKNDLPVKSGDTVSIIRTTSCPKGKWLARDANHKYGYISVMNVELNIKEMLELGKRASQAACRAAADGDTVSIVSRSSNHQLVITSSFTDDSEEWTCDEDTLSPSMENRVHQTVSMPEMLCSHAGAKHTLSDASIEDLHTQTRHEALQKLAIFFQHNEDGFNSIAENGHATHTDAEDPSLFSAVEEPPYPSDQEVDFADMEMLPPPELYADTL